MSRLRRWCRLIWVVGLLAPLILTAGSSAGAALTPDDPGGGYALPLDRAASVLRGFEVPPTPYAAGHRGVDLGPASGALVLAAGAGLVTFAGSVAGRGVVVIAHPDGVSTEYEPVAATARTGQVVARGDPIGTVSGDHAGCSPGDCLHWGAKRAGVYFDPMTLLHPLGRVHLVPWTG